MEGEGVRGSEGGDRGISLCMCERCSVHTLCPTLCSLCEECKWFHLHPLQHLRFDQTWPLRLSVGHYKASCQMPRAAPPMQGR